MKKEKIKPIINQDESNQGEIYPEEIIKPVSYEEKIKEIQSINDSIVTSINNKAAYKEKLKNELSFLKAEIAKAENERKKATSEDAYNAADEKIKRFTIQKNFTLQQLNNNDVIKSADFHKYGDTITADYNTMLEDIKKRAVEKCAELVAIVKEYNQICDITNQALHDLNNAAGVDPLEVNGDYPTYSKDDLYRCSEEYEYLFLAIERKSGNEAMRDLYRLVAGNPI